MSVPPPRYHTVRSWDAQSGQYVAALTGSRCGILTVGFSPNGSLLVASTGDHAVLRWDASSFARLPQVERDYNCSGELRSRPGTLGWTPDGKLIASAPSGGIVELWSAETGQLHSSLTEPGHTLHVRSVAVSPRDSMVVATGGEKMHAWQLPGGTEVAAPTSTDPVDSLAFGDDGRFLFGASRRGTVSIWSMPAGTLEVTLGLADEASAFALSPGGLVEWLGSRRPEALCHLGERLYPPELCEERYLTSGLIAGALSGHGVITPDD
jgi:WD40 repeat protein